MSIRGTGRSKPRTKLSKGARERAEKLAEAHRVSNREADTIYWMVFTPIGQLFPPPSESRIPSRSDLWRIILLGNPESNPEFIDRAIREFETKHNINPWSRIASVYAFDHEYAG